MSDLNDIYSALMSARHAVTSLATWQRSADGRDATRSDAQAIERGIAAYERLQRDLRDGRKHVELPEDYKLTNCQCGAPNASPPCSWCCDPDNDPDKQGEEVGTVERARQADAAQDGLTVADYEEALADHRRLVRELDVALNGQAGAAKQASLSDIVKQVQSEGIRAGAAQVGATLTAQQILNMARPLANADGTWKTPRTSEVMKFASAILATKAERAQ